MTPREIRRYIAPNGKAPFTEWLDSLRDRRASARIKARLRRIEIGGSLGDFKSVGNGAFELKIDYGPGYRVYFGQSDSTIILLLCGGDKSSQERDIKRAKEYWADYEKRRSADQ